MSWVRQLVLALAVVVVGCSKRAQLVPARQDAQQALERALADLEAKRYRQTQERLTFIIFNFPGSHQASDAQYYLAESYLRSQDYVQAQTEFEFYTKSFPNGRFQEEATYKQAAAYLRSAPGRVRDQSRALKAKEIVEQFLEAYPDSPLRGQAELLRAEVDERLAQKEFDAARLYYASGEYQAALVYYDYIAKAHPAAQWPGIHKYQFAVCRLETGDSARARLELSALAADAQEPKVKNLACAKLRRVH